MLLLFHYIVDIDPIIFLYHIGIVTVITVMTSDTAEDFGVYHTKGKDFYCAAKEGMLYFFCIRLELFCRLVWKLTAGIFVYSETVPRIKKSDCM